MRLCGAIAVTKYPFVRSQNVATIQQHRPQRHRRRADSGVSSTGSGRRAVRTADRSSRRRSSTIRRSVAAANPSKDCRALRHLFREENEGKCSSILAAKTENYSPSSACQQCDKLTDNPRMCKRCQKKGLPECPPRRKWEPKRDKVG